MNKYNPEIHKRRSIRLKNFDYSREGLYFITICCKNREHLFGEIVDGKMILNDIGEMAQICWNAIPEHFENVSLHSFVIMPNHVHGIIEIVTNVGAKYFSPENNEHCTKHFSPEHDEHWAKHFSSENDEHWAKDISPQPKGTSKTVGSIVRGFKIGVTKWVRQNTDIYQVWQRNYHEHIIRNENAYIKISEYIRNNPQKWDEDCFYL